MFVKENPGRKKYISMLCCQVCYVSYLSISYMLWHVCKDSQPTAYVISLDTSLFYSFAENANANEFQ